MATRVIISGGGTGGHVFPAIAIGDALKRELPDCELLFVGAKGRMEMERVPAAGYEIVGLPVAGFQRRLTFKNFTFFFKLIQSLCKARKLIRGFKPHVVVGVGGYASGPVLKIAASNGIPTLIQEQNSFPGVTNRVLAKSVSTICVAYPGMEKYFPARKIVVTGNPVRSTLINPVNREKALTHFGLLSNMKTILVVGGSLGAGSINKSIASQVNLIKDEEVQILWQCGKGFFETHGRVLFEANSLKMAIHPFIDRMDLAYGVADIVISRAGACTISELSVLEKPAILVPSPNVAEDHQTKNARALADTGAAILVKDEPGKILPLIPVALELLKDQQKMDLLALNIKKFARPSADTDIAREVLKLVKH